MKAIWVLAGTKWTQLTEAIAPTEAEEWLQHYKRWFPDDKFQIR
jgi:hypothetical protein